MNKSVCLITPGHIASNPRIVKEAYALYESGYNVKVIFGQTVNSVKELDNSILENVGWNYAKIEPWLIIDKVRSKMIFSIFKLMHGLKNSFSFFESGLSQFVLSLGRAVLYEKADLYIAHNLAALPVAVKAASKYRSKVGFDAEDYHLDEVNYSSNNNSERNLKHIILKKYLHRCDYLTASSDMIADEYYKTYGVKMETILNVFPLEETSNLSQTRNIQKPPTIYWFSQIIGNDRGLESVIKSLSLANSKIDLYLRGSLEASSNSIEKLKSLGKDYGVIDRLHFLDAAPPLEMVTLASKHDIGLSTELSMPYNRNICLTNKIFTYLLAGIPVLLSKTDAQTFLAKRLEEAAILVDINNPQEIANHLDEMFCNKDNLLKAKQKAYYLGRNQFNWDIEKNKFLKLVNLVLN